MKGHGVFMEENFRLEEGTLVIRMPKEIDHHAAAKLRLEADYLIDAYPVRRLVFDFAETEFMDSSGIGVIIGRSRNMGYRRGEVVARNLNSRVEKIFLVSGLHKIIKTESEA
jgi:stage II sporulation protein AA (anti-sigma F factor antagonist)